eukprot:1157903-Pelagomonas_calceolata.AAC.10
MDCPCLFKPARQVVNRSGKGHTQTWCSRNANIDNTVEIQAVQSCVALTTTCKCSRSKLGTPVNKKNKMRTTQAKSRSL